MNDYDSYLKRKNILIELYERYKNKYHIEGLGLDLRYLEEKVNKLKNDKFTISVIGNVKAGKSTLLNALLGKEILPSEVLQATKAIVEIEKSREIYLKIKYVDGSEQEIKGEEEKIKLELYKLAKVPDEYRDIPFTLIDDLISENKNNDFILTEEIIKKLSEKSNIEDLYDKKEKIENYIKERKLKDIPQLVQLGYPFPFYLPFETIKIADTPGVQSIGGLEDITLKYICNSNAIFFVKTIKPAEDANFKKFVEKIAPDYIKDLIFLVLTHAGNESEQNIKMLYDETVRLYSSLIQTEKIFAVDSLLKIIYNDLNRMQNEEVTYSDETKEDLLHKFKRKAEKEGKDLKEFIFEKSGFKKLEEELAKFSVKAPYYQIKDILEKLQEAYDNLVKGFNSELDLLQKNKKEPQSLAAEIEKITTSLEEYEKQYKEGLKTKKKEVNDQKNKVRKRLEFRENQCLDEIEKKDNIEEIRKLVIDCINDFQEIVSKFSSDIKEKLKEFSKELSLEYENRECINVPSIDFDSIEQRAKVEAEELQPIFKKRPLDFWDIITFGFGRLFREKRVEVGKKKVINPRKEIKNFRNYVKQELQKVRVDLAEGTNLDKFIENNFKIIEEELNKLIKNKKSEYEKMKQELDNVVKIENKIKETTKKKDEVEKEIEGCLKPFKEDLYHVLHIKGN